MSPRLAKLQQLLAADPRDAFTLYALAQEHSKAGDYAQAVTFFDLCIEVDAAYCYAYYHKARAQQAAGQRAAARATALAGVQAATRAQDAKALGELSTLQVELSEG